MPYLPHGRVPATAPAVAAFWVIGLIAGSAATAGSTPKAPCTYGEAQHTFQAPYNSIDPNVPGSGNECQYRLFIDGETFTFCEGDFILGGVIYFWEYQALGMSRKEAIADIELYDDHV